AVAGGAAGIAPGVSAATVKKQIDRLETTLDSPAASRVLKKARTLLPRLDTDPKARAQFADLIRSVVSSKSADVEDASKEFFARKGGDLMDRLAKPLAPVGAARGR